MAAADMDERARALEQIAALARQHQLSAAEIAAALDGTPAAPPGRRGRNVLVRVLGFLGGTFVFAGIGVFIALQWDEMNSAARVIVTLGSGLAVFVMGVLSARDVRFDKATAPLLLVAAAGFVYLSVLVHSRTLLVVATLAILAYTGWFTGEHFADSIGWPLALIAFGIFMIGLSAVAFRIDRDYVRKSG
jgi:MFS family permease